MGKIEELETALDEQTTAIATEKEQVRTILSEQTASIAALEEQLANNGTSEKIQELLNKVKANTAALVKIYEVPGEEGEETQE